VCAPNTANQRRCSILRLRQAGCALFFGVAVAMGAAAKTPDEVPIGETLREAPMQGLSGATQKLSEFRGKPLIINVWASWCGPCLQEMGSLERLQQTYGGKQFNIIGISTDDYWSNDKGFLQKTRISFPNFIDSKPFPLEAMLGADRLPLTLLIDAKGKVLAKIYGAQAWDSPQALAMISKTLKVKL
jgi:thiol-disulfide isomerase/thioredoxin